MILKYSPPPPYNPPPPPLPPPVPPAPTYTLELTEDEMLALRSLAFDSKMVERFVLNTVYAHRTILADGSVGTDGKPLLIGKTLKDFWYASNRFLRDFGKRVPGFYL